MKESIPSQEKSHEVYRTEAISVPTEIVDDIEAEFQIYVIEKEGVYALEPFVKQDKEYAVELYLKYEPESFGNRDEAIQHAEKLAKLAASSPEMWGFK
ncbi:MAG: hypothetical protein WAP51_00055 [Candidatus Sungiibacteriota bacterium]